jgi:hypothetical protein
MERLPHENELKKLLLHQPAQWHLREIKLYVT